jgi:hypothetical protein
MVSRSQVDEFSTELFIREESRVCRFPIDAFITELFMVEE